MDFLDLIHTLEAIDLGTNKNILNMFHEIWRKFDSNLVFNILYYYNITYMLL